MLTPEQYTDSWADGEGSGIPIPTPDQIRPARRALRCPRTSPPGCDSRWSTATGRARRSAAVSRSPRRSTSPSSRRWRKSRTQRSPRSSPPRRSSVIDNHTGGVLAMVGGDDYEKEPFNLATNGHRQPGSAFKPFILARALEEGDSPNRGVHIAAEGVQVQARRGPSSPRSSRSRTTRTPTWARRRWRRRPNTPTTRSSPSSASRSAPRTSPQTAEKMGIQTDVSTNPAMLLGGLEHGRQPAGDGVRVLDPRALRPADRRHDGQRPRQGARTDRDQQGHDARRRGDPRRRGQDGVERRERRPDRAGARLGRRGHLGGPARERGLVGTGEAPRPATSRGARRERPTTTATRGSAAAPRTSPPACGSATRTATRR